eukprot:jgi/Mesvir1/28043/Mv04646-RA.1
MLQSVKKKLTGGSRSKSSSTKTETNSVDPPGNVVQRGGGSASGPAKAAAPAPAARPRQNSETQKNATSLYSEMLPSFRDVSASERQNLFIKKLQLCSVNFDFTDPTKNVKEKEIKRQTLLELVDYVNTGTGKFNEAVFDDITNMLAANLFRVVPPSSRVSSGSDNYDPEEEEPTLEPAWPHLQIVYEFLLRYVVSTETEWKVAKKYIDNVFVLRLLDLFDSEDPRERDYLKTILHRIYGKFMVHRPFIRKAINNIFYRFIFETERHNGIAELLEILGSIINGFALPLKEEHKVFLSRALLPLHKPKCIAMYHQQLAYCVTQFVEKDPKLAEPVLRGLLKYWPITNSQKEVLFLGELEEILELTQASEFTKVMVPIARQLAKCINSSHFQVAERALFFWNNDYIVSLIGQNRHVIVPILFSALERNNRSHWNAAVHGLTMNVRKVLTEMDASLIDDCQKAFDEEEAARGTKDARQQERWALVEMAAQANASTKTRS